MISKLIFVCTDNTCMGPIAETIFKNAVHGLTLEVCSRGLVVLFPEPVNPKAETLLATHGLIMSNHTARQFKAEEVDEDTLILTMNTAQKRRLATDFFINDNVYTLPEYAGAHGDVEDPYGKETKDYESCYTELYGWIQKVIYRLLHGKLPEITVQDGELHNNIISGGEKNDSNWQ
ncbi:MAG: hypothetical protein K2N63_17195 [Lachnospiraceae bacterium]|nr:hypothetical protein [Lachnospiraceae bacterium]